MATRTSRRRLLRGLAAGLPALAAGGALAQVGVLKAHEKPKSNPLPGDPGEWRGQFFQQALAERANGSAVETPVKPSELPGTAAVGQDAPSAAPRAAAALSEKADLVRMQEELRRALQKPVDQRKWTMVIDLRKCIGCSACTVACKAENHLPPGVVYRPVIEEETGTYPNVTRRFLPRPCMQCDDPPCVSVCPVGATSKRPDGIVVVDYNACIGCRYCITACPYGARYFDFGENYTDGTPRKEPYEEAPSPEYGREWKRDRGKSPVGNVRKCQFCLHRLNAGMLPACVTTCVGAATYFGDKNDPDSFVNELITSGRAIRLKEEMGTDPKVYYLV